MPGAKTCFVDVDEKSFTLCQSDLVKKNHLQADLKAIVVVHILGSRLILEFD